MRDESDKIIGEKPILWNNVSAARIQPNATATNRESESFTFGMPPEVKLQESNIN